MDISTLAPEEALEAVTAMETVEQLREAATSINMRFSGNTGEGTLRKNLMDTINIKKMSEPIDSDEDDADNVDDDADKEEVSADDMFGAHDPIDDEVIPEPIKKPKGPTIPELLKMNASMIIDDPKLTRQVVRAQALRMSRIRLTNLDPADAQLSGALISVITRYTGKVSKYIPFGDENDAGWHVPQILLDMIKAQKFALRREIKGGQFGVKKYKTSMVNKYSVEMLPMLTTKEIAELAAAQAASHSIDK